MDNDNPTKTGFTQYLEKTEFTSAMGNVDTRFNKIETTLNGTDGKSGLVHDVQVIITKVEIAEGLLRWVFGASALGTVLTLLNILKLFNLI